MGDIVVRNKKTIVDKQLISNTASISGEIYPKKRRFRPKCRCPETCVYVC